MKKNTSNNENVKTPSNKKLAKTIVSTMLKTLGVMFFVVGFFVVSMSVVAPRTTLKAFDAVGLNRAGYLVQKRLYARDPSNENLYNLIQRSIERGAYKDQAKYIEIMIDGEDYSKFCEEVDEATKRALGERYSIYADSYDTYLRRHLVVALYNTDRELQAKMMAIDSVYDSLDELYVYVGLVVTDEDLTEMQITMEMTTLYSRYSIVSALETKLLELDELLSMSSSTYNSVIVLEQKVKLAEIQYNIGKYAGNEALETSAELNKEEWTKQIKTLTEELKG